MNISAKCVKDGCPEKGNVIPTSILHMNGLGAGKDRYKCPECGELMQTVTTLAQDIKGSSGLKNPTRRITTTRPTTTSAPRKVGKKKVSTKTKLKVNSRTLGSRFKKEKKKTGAKKPGARKRI